MLAMRADRKFLVEMESSGPMLTAFPQSRTEPVALVRGDSHLGMPTMKPYRHSIPYRT